MIPMMREGRPPRPRGEPANMLTKRPGEEKQVNPATPPGQTQALSGASHDCRRLSPRALAMWIRRHREFEGW